MRALSPFGSFLAESVFIFLGATKASSSLSLPFPDVFVGGVGRFGVFFFVSLLADFFVAAFGAAFDFLARG